MVQFGTSAASRLRAAISRRRAQVNVLQKEYFAKTQQSCETPDRLIMICVEFPQLASGFRNNSVIALKVRTANIPQLCSLVSPFLALPVGLASKAAGAKFVLI